MKNSIETNEDPKLPVQVPAVPVVTGTFLVPVGRYRYQDWYRQTGTGTMIGTVCKPVTGTQLGTGKKSDTCTVLGTSRSILVLHQELVPVHR